MKLLVVRRARGSQTTVIWMTLESLEDDELPHLRILEYDFVWDSSGVYFVGSSGDLGRLGPLVKESTHLEEFTVEGRRAFAGCSRQSVDRFLEDVGRCCHIKRMNFTSKDDLAEIIHKLDHAMKNNNITRWCLDECNMGVNEARHLFNTFRHMESLKELYLSDLSGLGLNDNAMAGCIPSLAACKDIRELKLEGYSMSTNSCTALSAVFPRMTLLLELSLGGNSIDDRCVEVLVRGLVESRHLNMLDLGGNSIGDDGLDVLIQGLPASVGRLDVSQNAITLSRQLPLLRFKILNLAGNSLSPGGPQIVAASLVNQECHLEEVYLYDTYTGDEGATILAGSLLGNQRLTKMALAGDMDTEMGWNKITEMGWNAFLPILCNAANINATHGSNHTLKHLAEDYCDLIPDKVKTMLRLNRDQDTSSIAAKKILQTHHYLDMKPLFDRKLDLLPYAVAWLERFAESRLNLKLSSIYEFVRAIPTKVVEGVEGKKKGKKRSRDLLSNE